MSSLPARRMPRARGGSRRAAGFLSVIPLSSQTRPRHEASWTYQAPEMDVCVATALARDDGVGLNAVSREVCLSTPEALFFDVGVEVAAAQDPSTACQRPAVGGRHDCCSCDVSSAARAALPRGHQSRRPGAADRPASTTTDSPENGGFWLASCWRWGLDERLAAVDVSSSGPSQDWFLRAAMMRAEEGAKPARTTNNKRPPLASSPPSCSSAAQDAVGVRRRLTA